MREAMRCQLLSACSAELTAGTTLQAVDECWKMHVTDPSWLPDVLQRGSDSDHQALAAAVELSLRSNHPVSRAMARSGHAAGNQLPHIEIREFKAIPGASTRLLRAWWQKLELQFLLSGVNVTPAGRRLPCRQVSVS